MSASRTLLIALAAAFAIACDDVSTDDASPDGDADGDVDGDADGDADGDGDSDDVLRISGAMPGLVEVGQDYSFTPTASGPGGTLVFEVENCPAWASFDEATGSLRGTPSAADVGVYTRVVIRVIDGADDASLPPRSISVTPTAEGATTTLEELEHGETPEVIVETFNDFALTHFGAEREPLVYEVFGEELEIVAASEWQHISERSAVIALETNLPSKTRVEYGTTAEYGLETAEPERYYAINVHALRDLESDTTYHYRLISTDERGNTLRTADSTFTTETLADAIRIPGELGEPPYTLDTDGGLYLVTEDIVAEGSAFEVTGSGITLDLGGNVVTYADGTISDVSGGNFERSHTGVFMRGGGPGLRVLNGALRQGASESNGNSDGSLAAIRLADQSEVEIAGVDVEYHTAQTYAMYFLRPDGVYDVHHNMFLDRGWEVLDRHGPGGGRSVYFREAPEGVNQFTLHHNLIKRTRQNAIGKAQVSEHNEIYVDSWSTNSFAIGPNSSPRVVAGHVRSNRIFLTGYHAIGISWAHLDLVVADNFIHMESIDTADRRWHEDFGDRNSLNGLRLTNYGSGGQVRNNLVYERNTIVGRCRKGVEMRGTELFSDYSVTDVVVQDSIISVDASDDETTQAAAIVTQGTPNDDHQPLFYRNNRIISNICNVRFGDYYGRGKNHRFIGCTFLKRGENPGYHTFVFDGGYSTGGHVLLDPVFEGGAAYDDVRWERTGDLSHYSIQWTLALEATPGASVEVRDVNGDVEYSGEVDADGQLQIPLTQAVIRPVEWTPSSTGSGVNRRDENQEIRLTPHSVTVIDGSETRSEEVSMDHSQTLSL